jgi:hypothetical protein
MNEETQATVVTDEAGKPEAVVVELPENLETPSSEQLSDAAVAIAAIEADKEVQIAEINADARKAEAEAYSDNRESEQWQTKRISALEAELAETRARLAALESEPVSSPLEETLEEVMEEQAAEELAETVAEELTALETDLTQPSTVDPTSSIETEHSEKSEDEKLEPEVELTVGRRPIIQLV